MQIAGFPVRGDRETECLGGVPGGVQGNGATQFADDKIMFEERPLVFAGLDGCEQIVFVKSDIRM